MSSLDYITNTNIIPGSGGGYSGYQTGGSGFQSGGGGYQTGGGGYQSGAGGYQSGGNIVFPAGESGYSNGGGGYPNGAGGYPSGGRIVNVDPQPILTLRKPDFLLTHQVPGNLVFNLLTVENNQLTLTLCNIWQFFFGRVQSLLILDSEIKIVGPVTILLPQMPLKALKVFNVSSDHMDPLGLLGLSHS